MKSSLAVIGVLLSSMAANAQTGWQQLDPENVLVIETSKGLSGFLGSVSFEGWSLADAIRRPDGLLRAWGAYCPGVVGMGRQDAPTSGNSEIFFMLDASRRLDRDYTVWGCVIDGFQVLLTLALGEPPVHAGVMTRVRVLVDVPAPERPDVSLPNRSVMAELIARVRNSRGADFSVCDAEVPARIGLPASPRDGQH